MTVQKKYIDYEKFSFLLFLLLGLLIGCSDETDFKPDAEIQPNLVKSRSSGMNTISVVPLEIIEEIARKYPLEKGDRFEDNSETSIEREVKEYHSLPDKMGVTALYVITYKNDHGYLVVSADWRHEPICAIVKKGTYPDIEAPSMQIEWFEATIENIEYIRYYDFDNSRRARKAWKEIDDELDIQTLVLPDDECCEECPNYPDCELDIRIGCGGDSQELCHGITDDDPCGNWTYTTVGPLMTTEWGQECSYNDLCVEEECNGDLLDCPDNCSDNPLTGCVATAMAQVIRYWQIPTSHGYNYASMPDNSGNVDVQQLMYDAGCSVNMDWGCGSSSANDSDIPDALLNEFGFESADRDSYGVGSYQTVVNDLNNGFPVLLGGYRTKNTFLGIIFWYSNGHEWVCDGYFRSSNYCYSYLEFYMNWGWNGRHNGWFAFNNWTIPANNRNYQYWQDYIHDIHP